MVLGGNRVEEEDRVRQLETEVDRLMGEVDRYRTASEDTLQQINWCIGYFTATKNARIANSLSATRDHIRSNLLGQAPQSVPTTDTEPGLKTA
jgi:hypothetical protein